jgi:hypothetical protein
LGDIEKLMMWCAPRQDSVDLLQRGTAPAHGPPATLPSDPALDDGSDNENVPCVVP